MVVNYATVDPSTIPDTNVVWGMSEDDLSETRSGEVHKFTDGGSEKRVIYIHVANMTGL